MNKLEMSAVVYPEMTRMTTHCARRKLTLRADRARVSATMVWASSLIRIVIAFNFMSESCLKRSQKAYCANRRDEYRVEYET